MLHLSLWQLMHKEHKQNLSGKSFFHTHTVNTLIPHIGQTVKHVAAHDPERVNFHLKCENASMSAKWCSMKGAGSVPWVTGNVISLGIIVPTPTPNCRPHWLKLTVAGVNPWWCVDLSNPSDSPQIEKKTFKTSKHVFNLHCSLVLPHI